MVVDILVFALILIRMLLVFYSLSYRLLFWLKVYMYILICVLVYIIISIENINNIPGMFPSGSGFELKCYQARGNCSYFLPNLSKWFLLFYMVLGIESGPSGC
jgi:hypothetical protein